MCRDKTTNNMGNQGSFAKCLKEEDWGQGATKAQDKGSGANSAP